MIIQSSTFVVELIKSFCLNTVNKLTKEEFVYWSEEVREKKMGV